ncbi:MAG: hypothetical protein E7642_01525 [Ruminococcaceae bacterium]|nr:hypothetical protein [Oscillospiraceae bacterium]
MRAEIVSFSASGEDAIAVGVRLFEGENSQNCRFVIPSALYVKLGLCKGECSCELFDKLEHESKVYEAYKRGICVLGFGACSQRMLVSKLIAKGYERAIAREAVCRIVKHGYLCERDSAIREAERGAAKLWGASRIRAGLCSKGYSAEAVDAAMFALEDSGVDFEGNCVRLIESRYKKIPTDRLEIQKLIASVSRYGYSLGEIKAACCVIANKKKSIYED